MSLVVPFFFLPCLLFFCAALFDVSTVGSSPTLPSSGLVTHALPLLTAS
jgi:hypothetical protein